jgi:hypothetical protein
MSAQMVGGSGKEDASSSSCSLEAAFVAIYKGLYLTAILANSIIVSFDRGLSRSNLHIYSIDLLFFAINAAPWLVGTRLGRRVVVLEVTLSVGRMITVVSATTIFFAAFIAAFSPVGWILWYKLMLNFVSPERRPWYWLGCAVLLGLESFYCRSVAHLLRKRDVATQ